MAALSGERLACRKDSLSSRGGFCGFELQPSGSMLIDGKARTIANGRNRIESAKRRTQSEQVDLILEIGGVKLKKLKAGDEAQLPSAGQPHGVTHKSISNQFHSNFSASS